MTFKSTFGALMAATAVTMISIPAQAEEATVKEITVTADSNDAMDMVSQQYYPSITKDLNEAILAAVPIDDNPAGYTINVNITSLAFDGDTALPDNHEFNEMNGMLTIDSMNSSSADVNVPVSIIAHTGDSAIPEGYVAVNPSRDDFYNAMIAGYAQAVASRLPDAMASMTPR